APLASLQRSPGRLFIEFALSVSGPVVISAFVALTLSLTMSARVLKSLEGAQHGPVFNFFERGFSWLSSAYERGLKLALRHRVLMVGVTIGTLAVMVLAFRGLEQDFLPQEDKSRMFCLVLTPNGSTSEFTDRQLRKAEKIIASVPEVATYGAMVAPGFNGPGQGNLVVVFVRFMDLSHGKRWDPHIGPGP